MYFTMNEGLRTPFFLVTLTGKAIKETFKVLGFDGEWCYNTSFFEKNKEGLQLGLLDILTGKHTPSVAIRGDVFEKLLQEKKDAEDARDKELANLQGGAKIDVEVEKKEGLLFICYSSICHPRA